MNLPSVKFTILSNGLGQQLVTADKVEGLIATGVAVAGAGNATLNKSYQFFSLKDAEAIGIVAGGTNDFVYQHLKNFYAQAGDGAEYWLILVAAATTYTDMLDLTKLTNARQLLNDAGGRIRILGAVKKSAGNEASVGGLDGDVHTAVVKAQELADYFAGQYMPVRVIISGNNFSGAVADLKDYSAETFPRVLCLLANNDGSKVASVGLAMGRLSKIPVQRNIGRVKDGAVEPAVAYFTNAAKIEALTDAWDAIHNKGYVFLRSYVNKSGYYFTGDVTLVAANNDFNRLARGLVMDKAIVIAYAQLVENLLDEVEVASDGSIHPAIIKSWQADLESALQVMVADSNLSDAQVYIDETQKVLTTGTIKVVIRLLPVGYAEYIEVEIGFTTQIEN